MTQPWFFRGSAKDICRFRYHWTSLLCLRLLTFGGGLLMRKRSFLVISQAFENTTIQLSPWPKLALLMERQYIWAIYYTAAIHKVPPDHLLLDRSSNIGPLLSCWELEKFKNCWNKSFRTSKILTLLYQQFSYFLIFQRDMSGPRLGALSNNRWLGGIYKNKIKRIK